jgi:hypothetical protein
VMWGGALRHIDRVTESKGVVRLKYQGFMVPLQNV